MSYRGIGNQGGGLEFRRSRFRLLSRLIVAITVVTLAFGEVACNNDGPAGTTPTGTDTIKPHGALTYAFRNDSIIDVTLHATDNVAVTRVTVTVDTLLPCPMCFSNAAVEDTVPIKPGPTVDVRFSVDQCPYLRTCRIYVDSYDAAGNFNSADHSGELVYAGPKDFTVGIVGLPSSGVVNRVGMVLAVRNHGPTYLDEVFAYLDSGTAAQRVYGTARLTNSSGEEVFRILDPLPNGAHTLSVAAKDAFGTHASWHGPFSVAVASVSYRATILAVPGAIDSRGADINTTGDIAGSATFADSSTQAIRWDSGVAAILTGGRSSSAMTINDAGDVAGIVAYSRNQFGQIVGDSAAVVVWRRDGTRRTLAPGTVAPRRIAANGDLVLADGRFFTATSTLNLGFGPAEMNDLGLVVGNVPAGLSRVPPSRAVTFRAGAYDYVTPFGLDYFSAAVTLRHVNNSGQITGMLDAYSSSPAEAGLPVAFVLQNGNAVYGWSGVGKGRDDALNNHGQILSHMPDGTGIVWTVGGATTYVTFDALDWSIDEWKDINDRGQILTHAVNTRTGQKAVLLLDPM